MGDWQKVDFEIDKQEVVYINDKIQIMSLQISTGYETAWYRPKWYNA